MLDKPTTNFDCSNILVDEIILFSCRYLQTFECCSSKFTHFFHKLRGNFLKFWKNPYIFWVTWIDKQPFKDVTQEYVCLIYVMKNSATIRHFLRKMARKLKIDSVLTKFVHDLFNAILFHFCISWVQFRVRVIRIGTLGNYPRNNYFTK